MSILFYVSLCAIFVIIVKIGGLCFEEWLTMVFCVVRLDGYDIWTCC